MFRSAVISTCKLALALHQLVAPGLFYVLYDLTAAAVLIFSIPVIIYKTASCPDCRRGFMERLGFLPAPAQNRDPEQKVVWIHAASVGETMAAGVLVSGIRKKYSGCKIIFSALTPSGVRTAAENIEEADAVICLPFDLSFITDRVAACVRPSVLVLVETELWPNLIKSVDKLGAGIMVASGVLSSRSLDGYGFLQPLAEDMLSRIDVFSMQTQSDARRIISLGADADRVSCDGNIKFDRNYNPRPGSSGRELAREFKIPQNSPVIAAGSTHRGEEKDLICLYKQLKKKFPELVMVIAPRYISRAREIFLLCRGLGVDAVFRTSIDERSGQDMILLDTMGELAGVYELSDVVFVGGSLVDRGGHNILEAAACGKPVLFGPYMGNFIQEKQAVIEQGLGFEVSNAFELAAKTEQCLQLKDSSPFSNEKARVFMEKNRGASERSLALLSGLLEKGPKIAIIRLSAMGDVVHALPAAASLRSGMRRSELTWIVEDKFKDLPANNPHLDRVVALPRSRWAEIFKRDRAGAAAEALCFFAGLKKFNFDIALDLHGIFKSALTCFLSGAPIRIGPGDGREASTLFYTFRVPMPEEKFHQVERNLYLSGFSGAGAGAVEFGITPSPEDKESAFRMLRACGISPGEAVAVLNPFTTWQSKDWSNPGWAELADRLAGGQGYRVVFTGHSRDRSGIEEIISLMEHEACNLAGETSLIELAALYSVIEVFVGGDTGPTHLAAAMGAGVVSLMGPTTKNTHGPVCAVRRVIQKNPGCSGCWKRVCPLGTSECMKSISAKEVADAVRELV